jgi:hypothetical protein
VRTWNLTTNRRFITWYETINVMKCTDGILCHFENNTVYFRSRNSAVTGVCSFVVTIHYQAEIYCPVSLILMTLFLAWWTFIWPGYIPILRHPAWSKGG